MRTQSFAGGTINYPDRVVFAYNPNYIRLNGLLGVGNSCTISFVNPRLGSKRITINVDLVGNSAEVYISKFLQLQLFGARAQRLNVAVSAGSLSTNIELLCIDGSLSFGERFGQIGSFAYDPEERYFVRRVRWFKNMPFKVSIFADNSNTGLSYRYDGNGYSGANTLNEGYNDIDPKTLAGDANRFAVLKVTPDGDGLGNSTFDSTYDASFRRLLDSVSIIRLNVDLSTDGHYFRWIDPMGQLQYFLFIKGTEQTKVTDSDYYEEPVESNGMYFGVVKRTLEKTRTRELKCCAVNLTQDEQDYVKTIVSSIKCEMYLGKNGGYDVWMPVNVKAGSFSVSEQENLQDFEIVAELPISQTQTR